MGWPGYEKFIPPQKGEPGAKPSKYRSRKTTLDGIVFDSAKEAKRWRDLRLLEKAGQIRWLRRQEKFRLDVNGDHICDYVADFVYYEGKARVVEDVKSVVTRRLPAYRLKVKLMRACHGIEIREV